MKILHYSDQGDPNIRNLFSQADILVTTGDLSIFDLRAIEDLIPNKPCFGVYGNHCVPGYLEELKIINLHLKVYQWKGLLWGGFQGCPRYKDGGGPQFTDAEARIALVNFPRVDVLLLHAAPLGLLDTPNDPVHIGSQAVRDYVDKTKPKVIFCGHDSPNMELDYQGIKIYRTHQSRIIGI